MKTIKVPLSVAGIDNAIREIDRYKSWLKARTSVLLDRLAQEGLSVASANFAKAAYDGTNDVSVSVEQREQSVRAVVAVGASVLFIEFGTGVVYPDNHPEAADLGMRRGEYGAGHVSNRPGATTVTLARTEKFTQRTMVPPWSSPRVTPPICRCTKP